MNQYIQNLIPRLRQFSENLDRNEIYVDAPWVLIDEEFNKHKYIFKRNGELVMSLNGQATIGRWEYLPAARSLLIERRKDDAILLNQNFIDPAVMILKKDGAMENYFILANEILMPDLNVDEYLKRLYIKKNNITIRDLKNGIQLEIKGYGDLPNYDKGSKVSICGEAVADGTYQLLNTDKKYIIRNSRIEKILVNQEYETDKGKITIEQQEYHSYCIGDSVFLNNNIAPDGKYKFSFFQYIKVKNGIINDLSIL